MDNRSEGEVTRGLAAWSGGDDRALDEILPRLYGELRQLAGRYLQREREGLTLQTHDLIHEAFLRLVDQRHVDWQSRSHFFAVAAQMMRRILVDRARRRHAGKHGGGLRQVALDEVPDFAAQVDMDLVALDDALRELGEVSPTLAQLVDLRFFGGLEGEEVAAVLGVSPATVARRWRTARTWLYGRLHPEASPAGEAPDGAP